MPKSKSNLKNPKGKKKEEDGLIKENVEIENVKEKEETEGIGKGKEGTMEKIEEAKELNDIDKLSEKKNNDKGKDVEEKRIQNQNISKDVRNAKDTKSDKNIIKDSEKNVDPSRVGISANERPKENLQSTIEAKTIEKEDSIDATFNPLISVKDIIDALSIILTPSRVIAQENKDEFLMELMNMVLELPKETENIDSELTFEYDNNGRWCVAIAKQRVVLAISSLNVLEYPTLLMSLHHTLMGTTKEFFRIFRIKKKILIGNQNIIDPMVIGFDNSLNNIVKDNMRRLILDNVRAFAYIPLGPYDEIPLVMNPILSDFHRNTQGYILENDIALRDWFQEYLVQKRILSRFNAVGNFGYSNCMWARHANPRFLPRYIVPLANFNLISVAYCSQLVVPVAVLSELDISQLSQTLQTNANRAEPLTDIVLARYDSNDYEDFRRILLAIFLPGQVRIDVDFSKHANSILSGVTALVVRLLFSTTPGMQNISNDSAENFDHILGDFLVTVGYTCPNGAHPLEVESRRLGANVWAQLAHDPDSGRGWINHESVSSINLPQPLYEGLNTLPCYAGINQYININDRMDASELPNPRIWDVIIEGLEGASARREVDSILRLFRYKQTAYLQFLAGTNKHIFEYGQTGFRLGDALRVEMANQYGNGGIGPARNSPIRLKIRDSSIYKFFLRLPQSFEPNILVMRQPIAESFCSSELQRIYALYISVVRWVERDGRAGAYPRRRIFKMIHESNESNHLAKQIINICMSNGELRRFNLDIILQLAGQFDDFEAIFMPQLAEIVYDNNEFFGFTRQVIRRPANLRVPEGAQYQLAASSGILATNLQREGHFMPMTLEEFQTRLNSKDLLSTLNRRSARHLHMTLPVYCLYKENRGDKWIPETSAWHIDIPTTYSATNAEEFHPGVFTRQILYPPKEGPAFPDQYLLTGSFVNFRATPQQQSLTFTAVPGEIIGQWVVRAQSYKDYVIVKSPLEYESDLTRLKMFHTE